MYYYQNEVLVDLAMKKAKQLLSRFDNPDASMTIDLPDLDLILNVQLEDLTKHRVAPKTFFELSPLVQKYRDNKDPFKTYKMFLLLTLFNQLIPSKKLLPVAILKRLSRINGYMVLSEIIRRVGVRYFIKRKDFNEWCYCLPKEDFEILLVFIRSFGTVFNWEIKTADCNEQLSVNILPNITEDIVGMFSRDNLEGQKRPKKLSLVTLDNHNNITQYNISFSYTTNINSLANNLEQLKSNAYSLLLEREKMISTYNFVSKGLTRDYRIERDK